ncbi:MAG: chondroitinase family polysaccharide lyase [Planctomycetota bacterium]
MTESSKYSFEDEDVPQEWDVLSGQLCLSPQHYKDGRQSLKWEWDRGGVLQCDELAAFDLDRPCRGVKAWIYSEDAVDDDLVIELGSVEQLKRGSAPFRFRFHLDFEGWRACWLALEEGRTEEATEESLNRAKIIQFRGPESVKRGELYFDAVEFLSEAPPRSADYQMPQFEGETGGWWGHEPLVASREKPRRPLPDSVTEEDRDEIQSIRRRYEKWLLGSPSGDISELPDPTVEQVQDYIEKGWDNYRDLDLKVDEDGNIRGPGLTMGRAPGTFYHVFYNVMLPLAIQYAYDGDEKSRRAVINLFDYVHDQGWAEGSSGGTLRLNGLQFGAYCHSLYLMREVLREEGRLADHLDAAFWYLSFGKAFRAKDEGYQESNADELRSTLFTSIPVILSLPESPRQVQYLRSWKDWFESALEISPRFAGVFKPDGIGWHHRGVYKGAYTGSAYEMAALAMYLTRGTSYYPESWAVENLAHALRTQFLLAKGYSLPHAVRGRMLGNEKYSTEQPEWYGMCASYAFLALADDENAGDMAGLFARLWDPECELHEEALRVKLYDNFLCKETPGRRCLLEELAAKDIEPADKPDGVWMKPWGGLAVARQDNWLAAIKGWSQYVWDFECHPGMWADVEENVYSRFISNGSLQILATGRPDAPAALGCCLDRGWDWSRWPGTTAKHLELDELYSPTESWECRWFSDETFLGGVDCENGDGMIAMKLHDTCHDHSFRAIKSYFVFGDEIICLGSSIQSDDRDHCVETTLFQCYMSDPNMPMLFNTEREDEFPVRRQVEGAEPVTMVDPYDNGYIVAPCQSIHMKRDRQTSRTAGNKGPTEGDYATAWLDHGAAPDRASYEYAVLPQTNAGAVEEYAFDPPYSVLQKDQHAHVVEHTERGVTAYALFTPDRECPHGLIARTDTPITAMVYRCGTDRIVLRLADPNLRLPQRGNMGFLSEEDCRVERESHTVRVHLRGQWASVETNSSISVHKYNDERVVVKAKCVDGKKLAVKLRERAM